ncbi:MAG: Mfa1 fimbrilin C-terminal domain-containing protein, partial [Muribaculaceae bacterium]|nr:Mfa1 fimbrilin C-terminal domain-containing protein [Muribaculaceae bacterium]
VIYTRTDSGEKYADGTVKYTYNNITPDFLKVVSNAAAQGTGAVKIALTDEKKGEEYFIISGNTSYDYKYTDEAGDHTVTLTKPNAISKTAEEVEAYLATATAGTNNIAIGYKDGASYYPVCIEHLNNAANKEAILEGQYGVVRNHVYNIRITKINTLGEGVFVPRPENGDESETLIPPVKSPTYYVESNINILSWKVVSQEVEI